jgi:hypothetical protein
MRMENYCKKKMARHFIVLLDAENMHVKPCVLRLVMRGGTNSSFLNAQ